MIDFLPQNHILCDNMRNITVSVDNELYRKARIKAAEKDRSLSALVRDYLTSLTEEEEAKLSRRREELKNLYQKVSHFRLGHRFTREEIYDRKVLR